ncbi:TolC family protein [Cognatishimia activa]|uniref:TolC family protein n=1 Tax=Cognatishimia activa TaxID=1715691 RepID=UPI001FDF8504|nr:TolC family protein [Cognatishimia activa]
MAHARLILPLIASLALTGCVSDLPTAKELMAKLPGSDRSERAAGEERKGLFARRDQSDDKALANADSEIITELQNRHSVLHADSTYGQIAQAALATGASAAEAELRSAKLRAEAANKNWLPTIGPSISLTSLGEVITSLLVEQVVFDNGKRKAERAFAAADVEVAAVSLSEDMNERVFTAVSLYVSALRGQAKAQEGEKALGRMRALQRVVDGRVRGGVSNKGDLRTVDGKVLDLQNGVQNASESAAIALSELRILTKSDFPGVPVGNLSITRPSVDTLAVIRASAEGKRSVAQAKAERAAKLPSIKATATANGDGVTGGLRAGSDQGFGFGTGAELRAIQSTQEAAERQVVEARQKSERSINRLEHRISSLKRQEMDAAALADEGHKTFRLFESQFKAGQRSVIEVVNAYEKSIRRRMEHLDAKYDVMIAQLELARDLGLLASGDQI